MLNETLDFLPDIVPSERDPSSESKSSESETNRSWNKNIRNTLPESCAICGKKAIGYHYEVASCNGCKAFFRRTIITGRKVKCNERNRCFDESFPISRRKMCSGCRFAKCEKLGMNPMNIRAEITGKGELLKQQFLARRGFASTIMNTPSLIEDDLSVAISSLRLVENQLDKLFNSNIPENHGDWRSLAQVLQMKPILDISKVPNLKLLSSQLFPEHAGFAHNIYLTVVEYTKMFGSFAKLSQESIEKLIKHGASMCGGLMVCRRSIQTFNSDVVRRTNGTIAGKPSRSWNGVWVEHKEMIQKVLHSFLRLKLEDVEFLFLKAITMCNPAVSDLSSQDQMIIEKERFLYARNLLNHCIKTRGAVHGPARFTAILSMISVMEFQQKDEKSFYVILKSYFADAEVLVSPLYDEIMAS